MFKKILKKLFGRKDSSNTNDSSYEIDVPTPYISSCSSGAQYDAISRIKKARRDLSR